MPPKAKSKPKANPNKAPQELRLSTLQNGLYFYLLDNLGQQSPVMQFLKDLHITVDHSRKVLVTKRNAIFLNMPTDILPQSMFSEKTLKGAHLTLDKDYLEFDHDELTDRAKWHYAHYTEEYADSTKVHVYFNSNGIIVGAKTTNADGTITPISADQLHRININLANVADILKGLIEFKAESVKDASERATAEYSSIKNIISGNSLEDLEEVYSDYRQYTQLAQRYADTHLVLDVPGLGHEIEIYQGQQAAIAEASAVALKANDIDAAMAAEQQAAIKLIEQRRELEIANAKQQYERYKQRCDEIFGKKGIELLQSITEIERIRDDLLLLLEKPSDPKQKKDMLKLLNNIDDKLNTVPDTARGLLKPNTLTLDFLRQNFSMLSEYIDENLCIEIIRLAVSSNSQDLEKYRDICEFLYKNSAVYAAVIKDANLVKENVPAKTTGASKSQGHVKHSVAAAGTSTEVRLSNPLALEWLESCFMQNNLDAFQMLLRHGVDLGANAVVDETDHKNLMETIFRVLIHRFELVRQKSLRDEYAKTQATGAPLDTKKSDAILQKFIEFLNIMLEPEFCNGAVYEDNLRGRMTRAARLARLQNLRRFKKETDGKRVAARYIVDPVSRNGMFGVFEYAVLYNLPLDIINIIIGKINPEAFNLRIMAILLSKMVQSNNFSLLLNAPEAHNSLGQSPNSSFISVPVHIQPRIIADIHEANCEKPTGNFRPKFYVSAIAPGSATNRDFTEQQLAEREQLLLQCQTIFQKCFDSAKSDELESCIKLLLNRQRPKSEDLRESTISSFLDVRYAALFILFAMQPKVTTERRLDYYKNIMQCLIDIAWITKNQVKIAQMYDYCIFRLYKELQLAHPDIAEQLKAQIEQHNALSYYKDRAEAHIGGPFDTSQDPSLDSASRPRPGR
jgi:hypothetical protein